MRRGPEARLDRLVRRVTRSDRDAIEHYRTLRARAAIGAAVRWSLAQMGIDPASAVMLCVADEAAAELAALGEAAELRLPDEESPAGPDDAAADPDSWLDDATRRL